MTTIAYIFLDSQRENLVPLEKQIQCIEEYAKTNNFFCEEILVEQSYHHAVPLLDRVEGKKMVENTQKGDTIFVMQAKWVLGTPQNALELIRILHEKEVSLFCVDLDGNISMPTQRRLQSSEGIAPLVFKLCESFASGGAGKHAAAIRAGKERLKRDGKHSGGPVPFGWSLGADGKLKENEVQQEIIAEMVWLKDDRWSYRAIAEKMLKNNGLKFSHEGIRRILLKRKQKS